MASKCVAVNKTDVIFMGRQVWWKVTCIWLSFEMVEGFSRDLLVRVGGMIHFDFKQKRKRIYNVKNNHSCSVYDNRDEVSILQLQAEKPRLTKFLVHEYYIFYVSCDKR